MILNTIFSLTIGVQNWTKTHENTQLCGGTKYHFSRVEVNNPLPLHVPSDSVSGICKVQKGGNLRPLHVVFCSGPPPSASES